MKELTIESVKIIGESTTLVGVLFNEIVLRLEYFLSCLVSLVLLEVPVHEGIRFLQLRDRRLLAYCGADVPSRGNLTQLFFSQLSLCSLLICSIRLFRRGVRSSRFWRCHLLLLGLLCLSWLLLVLHRCTLLGDDRGVLALDNLFRE